MTETNQLNLAISVHAPWAWALMHGGKDVENRVARFPRRHGGRDVLGRVWVHASLWPGRQPVRSDFATRAYDKLLDGGLDVCRITSCLRGHIVGSVEVYAYRSPDDPPDSTWYIPGSLAIMVRNPQPLVEPVPAKGALGWWVPSLHAPTSGLD